MLPTPRHLLTFAALLAVACAPGTDPTPDAGGGNSDAGPTLPPVEPKVASACDEDRIIDVALSGNRGQFEVDTSVDDVRDLRPLDLGFECGNAETEEWAGAIVARLTIPGTGTRALGISTRNGGTDDGYVTVVQVRRDCRTIPTGVIPATCGGPTNDALQAEFVTSVQGGETVYLVVSGYAGIDGQQLEDGTQVFSYGQARVELELFDTEPPTIESGAANLIGQSFEVEVDGSDEDADAIGLVGLLTDADGAIVDVNGDGVGDTGDQLARTFLTRPTGESFTGVVRFDNVRAFFEQAGVRGIKVRAFDQGMALGNELSFTIGEITQVGLEAACDETKRCAPGLTCTTGTCAAPAAVATACQNASAVAIAPPDASTPASVLLRTQTLVAGAGVFEASCAPTPGKELVYAVPVPAEGKWDLIASTAVSGVAANVDTVLSIRSTCADANTELSCNDEASPQRDSRSIVAAEVSGGGNAYVVADYYGGIQTGQVRFNIQFTLRPVLPTGATCDKDQRLNRCERAYCNVDTLKCP